MGFGRDSSIFYAFIPTAILSVVAIVWLAKGMSIRNGLDIIGYILLTMLLVYFTSMLFSNATPYGWFSERVFTSIERTTEDGLYVYRLEVVNPFQRNAKARVHLISLETNVEQRIVLEDVRGRDDIRIISFAHRYLIELASTSTPSEYFAVILLRNNDSPVTYLLNTYTGTATRI